MLLKWIWFFFLFGISHRESCSFFTLGFQVKSQALKHKFKYNKAQLSDSCSGFCLIYLKREENQSSLPTVVDIMVIWVKFTIPVHFSSLIPRMSMFTLAISCLITSNWPWFMDLRFQVPIQCCSLLHKNLLLSPVTSTTGYYFCFGSIPSLFLELFLHWYFLF